MARTRTHPTTAAEAASPPAAVPLSTPPPPAEPPAPQATPPAPPPGLRLEWLDPATLADNPLNWRRHPPRQRSAISAALEQAGWAGALLFNEKTGHLIDGHARKELSKPGEKVPVLVGSWSEKQEALILATLDPLAAMAEADAQAFQELMGQVDTGGDERLDSLLAELASQLPAADVILKQLETKPPPAMTWILIAIPTVRFGELAADVERIAAMPGVLLETTVNDG